MNAREYYYTVIAPEEKGQSFQQAYQRADLESGSLWITEELRRNVLAHKPKLSNDWQFELQLGRFLEKLDRNINIKNRIGEMFVVKTVNSNINAFASASQEYSGDLVFFHVGLRNACFQYAIPFAELIYLLNIRRNVRKVSKTAKQVERDLKKDLTKLGIAQNNWRANGDHIILDDKTIIEPEKISIQEIVLLAGSISGDTESFILGHEIAHHLLGHTGRNDVGSELLTFLPLEFQLWHDKPDQHSQELQADALALLLLTGISEPNSWNKVERLDAVSACLGSLFTLTVIGQAVRDVTQVTETHPSVKDRFELCYRISRIFTPVDSFDETKFTLLNFQRLLFALQRHGLGAHANSLLAQDI